MLYNKFTSYFIKLIYVELKDDGNLILNIMRVTLKQDFHIAPLNFICLSDLHITQNLQEKENKLWGWRSDEDRNSKKERECWGENSGSVGWEDRRTENQRAIWFQ